MTSTDTDAGGPQRRTRQRTAIDAFLDTADDFLTAQQVHDAIRAGGHSIGLATVYRTLQAMQEAGEVDVMRSAEGEASYRRCSTAHHHHLVCRVCGKVVEVFGSVIEQWAEQVASDNGFTAVDHEVEIFGTCADCAA